MKHLIGCLESQSFSGSVIDSVFDHSQLLIGHGFHAAFLGDVLAQQSVEVFIAAALPTAIRIGKVGLDAQGLIGGLVIRKLFAVVHGQSPHPCAQGLEFVLNGTAHQVSALVGHFGQHRKAAFALDQCHDGLFVRSANDRITLPVANLFAQLNVGWAMADGAAIGNLAAPVTSTQVAFASGLMAAQVLVQGTASGLIRIDMQVNALVADLKLACDLLGTPLHTKVESNICPYLGIDTSGVAAALSALSRFAAGLLGTIASLAPATAQFAADGAAVPAQQTGNLADGLIGFQEAVNLVSFFSAEVLVHLATWTWRFKRP